MTMPSGKTSETFCEGDYAETELAIREQLIAAGHDVTILAKYRSSLTVFRDMPISCPTNLKWRPDTNNLLG